MAPRSTDLTTLIGKLAAARVDFILVGGLAAVAQGAPITTFDVDIVHGRSEKNVDRLLDFLASVNACYRGRPKGERLPPSKPALLGLGHSRFMTDLGPLDVLGAIEGGLTFKELLPRSMEIRVEGQTIRVLKLEELVDLKRASSHPKDKQVLPILEEALRRAPKT